MKSLIVTLALAFAAQANAEVLKSQLDQFRIKEPSMLFIEPVASGSVEINTVTKTISLRLGARYATEVKLLSTVTGECNEVRYTGKAGDNFPDAIHTSIEVIDYSGNTCMTVRPMRPTEVELHVSGGIAGIVESHSAGGEILTFVAPVVELSATLNEFQFQPNTLFANSNISAGSISVDTVNSTIQLLLYPHMICPHEMVCIAMVPPPISISLPLERVMTDRCGSITYTSKSDVPAEGGPRATLRVTDSSMNRCLGVVPTGNVAVALTFDAFIGETHTMMGNRN